MFVMLLKMVLGMAPNIIGRISDGFKNKRDLKNAIELEKLKHIREKGMADVNWEKAMAAASKDSWKDEFWTIIFGYLLLSPLWNPEQALVVFQTFSAAPEWFQLCVLVSVGASFGVKIWKNLK